MKIGELVRQHIKQIFFHCDNVNHEEIDSLLDPLYTKEIFGIDLPFCIKLEKINEDSKKTQSRRYWTEVYLVRGKRVRVTSQWIDARRPAFIKYLISKRIALEVDSLEHESNEDHANKKQTAPPPSSRANSRYRGNAIGNAQNLFIRNILSSLGIESFSEADWNSTKDYFSHMCAYCGNATELVMEHAIRSTGRTSESTGSEILYLAASGAMTTRAAKTLEYS